MRAGIHPRIKSEGMLRSKTLWKATTPMTDPEEGASRRGAIAGLLIAAAMLAVGLWLAHHLTAASKMQDCLMSGRTNCNVIQPAQ